MGWGEAICPMRERRLKGWQEERDSLVLLCYLGNNWKGYRFLLSIEEFVKQSIGTLLDFKTFALKLLNHLLFHIGPDTKKLWSFIISLISMIDRFNKWKWHTLSGLQRYCFVWPCELPVVPSGAAGIRKRIGKRAVSMSEPFSPLGKIHPAVYKRSFCRPKYMNDEQMQGISFSTLRLTISSSLNEGSNFL